MKKKFYLIIITIILLCLAGCSNNKDVTVTVKPDTKAEIYGTDIGGISSKSEILLVDIKSNTEESSYQLETVLAGTDFNIVGQQVKDKLKQEWNKYDAMTEQEKMLSSLSWGTIYIDSETWDECQESIGLTVQNPLEDIEWLNKTAHFGNESSDPTMPVTHIQTTVNAAPINRSINDINVRAGYRTDDVTITLSASMTADSGLFTTGNIYMGYATYEQNEATTNEGNPILIVITNGTNNQGYYSGNYHEINAYWVSNNVFYNLRVFGSIIDKDKVQATFDKIITAI